MTDATTGRSVDPADADMADGAPVHCFGEPGMEHCPVHPHHVPIAAGLFGVPSLCKPRPSNDGGRLGRMMSAA